MEAIETAFFEDPTPIYIALASIAVLGLVVFAFQGKFKSAWPTYLAIAAGIAVFAISESVVTQRERIVEVCDKIAAAVNNQAVEDIGPFLDKDFIGPEKGKTQGRQKALRLFAEQLKYYQVKSASYKILELEIDRDIAKMLVQTDIRSEVIPLMRVQWDVTWIKQADQWLVQKACARLGEYSSPNR